MVELNKKLDLERLRQMRGGDAAKVETTVVKGKPTKKSNRGKAKTQAASSDSDDSDRELKARAKAVAARESKLSDSDHDDMKTPASSSQRKKIQDEEDSDDLFDSEEEKMISEQHKTQPQASSGDHDEDAEDDDDDEHRHFATTKSKRKQRRTKSKKASKRRKTRDFDSDDESEEEEEEEEEEDVPDGEEMNVRNIKDAYSRKSSSGYEKVGGGSSNSKQKSFESLSEYQKHLLESQQQELPEEADDFDPADLNDYIKISLRRDQLIGMLNEPFFKKYVVGCYVRYSLSAIESTPVYRMCEILKADFESKPYKVPAPNGAGSVETTLRLTLSAGGGVREKMKIDRISNHTIKQNELDFHLKALESKKQKALTKRDVKLIRLNQKNFRNYVYSHDEIKRMVSNKVGNNKVYATDYSNAMEYLVKKRQEAIKNCDDDARRAFQKTIDFLEKENERQKQVFDKAYRKQIETNKKMRENNTKRDLLASAMKIKEEMEAQAKGILPNSIADPFVRRETRPKILWKSNKSLKEETQGDTKAATPRPAQLAAPTASSIQQNVNYEFVIPEDSNIDEVR